MRVRTSALFIGANDSAVRILNNGPDLLRYGTNNPVAVASQLGTLSQGQTVLLTQNVYIQSDGASEVLVQEVKPVPVWLQSVEPSGGRFVIFKTDDNGDVIDIRVP